MLRAIQVTALGGLLAALGAGSLARGQGDAKANDLVVYFDKEAKTTATAKGKIEGETPAGIRMKVREGKMDKEVLIPAAAVQRVYYYTAAVDGLAFNAGTVIEGRWETTAKTATKAKEEALRSALTKYREVEAKLDTRPEARRYIQYRIAMLLTKAAKEDPEKAEDALKALKAFTSGGAAGWQAVNALTTQARMLEDAGRTDEAREAYEALTAVPDLPPAMARQGEMAVGKLYLRAGKPADAEKRLAKLAASFSAADAEKPFADAYLAECKLAQGSLDGLDKTLGELLKAGEDAKLRALVHNLLGEWNEKKGKPEEAFWHFLRVDALYNEEPEEQARALFHLTGLFDKVKKDPVRGRECMRRLLGPGFEGTRFQKAGKAAGMKGEEK